MMPPQKNKLSQTTMDSSPRKRARRTNALPVQIQENTRSSSSLDNNEKRNKSSTTSLTNLKTNGTTPASDNNLSSNTPSGFMCPLTMEVMVDPVLDAEGNTYERFALLQWLQEYRTSPISRQPLSERMLVPNNALREAIHQVMGDQWVKDRQAGVEQQQLEREREQEEQLMQLVARQNHYSGNQTLLSSSVHSISSVSTSTSTSSSSSSDSLLSSSTHSLGESSKNSQSDTVCSQQRTAQQSQLTSRARQSPARRKINTFLQFAGHDLGGLALQLNERGCCAFRMEDITVVIDVPERGEMFCLYTRNFLLHLTEPMKDLLLELNFLQCDTRGGCLSVKKQQQNSSSSSSSCQAMSEVMFSYTDRVAEVSARDFVNIVLNFVETAITLRQKLLNVAADGQQRPAQIPA